MSEELMRQALDGYLSEEPDMIPKERVAEICVTLMGAVVDKLGTPTLAQQQMAMVNQGFNELHELRMARVSRPALFGRLFG